MLLRQDAVRINFGSKSAWPFATAEGDRILADLAWRWRWGDGQSRLGGAYESESHCCLGFHPALAAPVHQISFTQQIPPRWETGEEAAEKKKRSLTEHVAKAPTVLTLIFDQVIKADEEIFLSVLKARAAIVRLWLVERELPKDQYFQSRQRAPLSVTLSKVITIES